MSEAFKRPVGTLGFWGRFFGYFAAAAAITIGITLLCYQISDAAGYSAARWWFWISLVCAWQAARRIPK